MNIEPIIESGMSFGPYPEGRCFHIEESETYRNLRSTSSMKMVEFLLLHSSTPPIIWIIEVKKSSPRPKIKEKTDSKTNENEKFDNFIEEIRDKLINALSLYVAICLQRHSTENELPESFQKLDLKKVDFRFILIINGHKTEWLQPLKDALHKALKPTIAAWNLSPLSVLVFNDELAQKQKGLMCKKQE
ncbi:hypothetical protein [Spirulina sp. 06S082]|uniref:hypothetical protein n=1 Tax=Spirulina sp. 06S082 TaxID=3110248 RepID=UPI002B1F608C|nr:hypothetical protein [Spirulina sp. 06S082]MEA5470710.1 hypothetical protein [Spirulina sp. 06S082]